MTSINKTHEESQNHDDVDAWNVGGEYEKNVLSVQFLIQIYDNNFEIYLI